MHILVTSLALVALLSGIVRTANADLTESDDRSTSGKNAAIVATVSGTVCIQGLTKCVPASPGDYIKAHESLRITEGMATVYILTDHTRQVLSGGTHAVNRLAEERSTTAVIADRVKKLTQISPRQTASLALRGKKLTDCPPHRFEQTPDWLTICLNSIPAPNSVEVKMDKVGDIQKIVTIPQFSHYLNWPFHQSAASRSGPDIYIASPGSCQPLALAEVTEPPATFLTGGTVYLIEPNGKANMVYGLEQLPRQCQAMRNSELRLLNEMLDSLETEEQRLLLSSLELAYGLRHEALQLLDRPRP